jgi:MFS family permease
MWTLLGKRGEPLQQLMNFCVVIPVFLAMGFSLSFLGGVTGYHSFYTQFPEINTSTTHGALNKHNSLIKGVSVSSLNLGAVIGCLSTMYLGNKFGRRKTIFMGAIVALAGTVLLCAAFSLAQLIVARSESFQLFNVRRILTGSCPWCRSWYDVFHCPRMAVGNK